MITPPSHPSVRISFHHVVHTSIPRNLPAFTRYLVISTGDHDKVNPLRIPVPGRLEVCESVERTVRRRLPRFGAGPAGLQVDEGVEECE